jgi:putative transcriptional regulator
MDLMATHPNRGRDRGRNAHANPTPLQIAAAREKAQLTQTEAANVIRGSLRAWQDYEGGQRRMHPGLWELFLIKTGQAMDH